MNPLDQTTDPKSLPVISVVTPSYNQGRFVEETITSVLSQGYPRLQYFVIDGGSTDNSVEIIKKYAPRLDYWESQKDRGQSHAVNKGIARCTGDIFSWLNSDDVMMPGALHAVAKVWMDRPGTIIAGHTEGFDETGPTGISKARNITLKNLVRFWEAKDYHWSQCSTFVPLKVLLEIGALRENLHHCMDHTMLTELMLRGVEVSYVDQVVARFRFHADSKTVAHKDEQTMELVPTLRAFKNLPIVVEDWEWDAEIARRVLDLGQRDWRAGRYAAAIKRLGSAFATSPRGAVSCVSNRLINKVTRKK